MTDNEKLAAIENSIAKVYHGTFNGVEKWLDGVADADDVRWLIAEVRRLQTPATFGQTVLDMIETHCPGDNLPVEDKADYSLNAWLRMRAARDEAIVDKGREYARGRADERAAVVAWLSQWPYAGIMPRIERGEHVEKQQ